MPAEASLLLLSTIVHLGLLLLPSIACCCVAARKRACDLIELALIELVAIGGIGYLAFWLWFLSPAFGRAFTLGLPVAAGLLLIRVVPKLDHRGRDTLKALLTLMGCAGAAASLVLSVGFLFGGLRAPFLTAGTRFSHLLPGDNQIPHWFAEGVAKGQIPRPVATWRSSDRPPLQTGLVLSQYLYLRHPRTLQYTVTCVVLQSLWIVALWCFLTAFDLNQRSIALVIVVSLLSGFVFLNSFYVWPKLLAAAFALACSTLLLAPRFSSALHKTVWTPVLAGALAAFALLAHGGSLFAVLGLALTMLFARRATRPRALIILVGTCFCLYLPWTLYQKLCDPPGDRLLKYHLAGVRALDNRPFANVLASAYKSLTLRQIAQNRLANAQTVIAYEPEYWQSTGAFLAQLARFNPDSTRQFVPTAARVRALGFFFFLPNLGFLVCGPVCLLVGVYRRRSREWKIAALCWAVVGLTIVAWCLILFSPGETRIHQGSYATILLAFAGSVLAIWSLSPRLALLVSLLQISINFLLYTPLLRPLPVADPVQPDRLRYGTAILAVVSLVSVFGLLRSLTRRYADLPCITGPQ